MLLGSVGSWDAVGCIFFLKNSGIELSDPTFSYGWLFLALTG